MARRADQTRMTELAEMIGHCPNLRPGELAAELNWHRSSVTRCLPLLEERGILLAEDERGRLSHYSPPTHTDRKV